MTGALQAESSQRLTELACPKRLSEGYEPNRDVIWKVSVGAKTAVASSRYYTKYYNSYIMYDIFLTDYLNWLNL